MLGAAKRERLRRATTGKRVVVTGASSGLGAQCAVSFAAHGAIVALLARRKSRLHQVARQVRKLGGKSVVIPVDIGSPAGVKQASRRILTELGFSIGARVNTRVSLELEDWLDRAGTSATAAEALRVEFVDLDRTARDAFAVRVIGDTTTFQWPMIVLRASRKSPG